MFLVCLRLISLSLSDLCRRISSFSSTFSFLLSLFSLTIIIHFLLYYFLSSFSHPPFLLPPPSLPSPFQPYYLFFFMSSFYLASLIILQIISRHLLEELRKTTNNFSHDSRCSCWESNPAPPESKKLYHLSQVGRVPGLYAFSLLHIFKCSLLAFLLHHIWFLIIFLIWR